MSRLLEIRDQLNDTQGAIAQIERAIAAEDAESPSQSLLTTARTLQKRRRELEAEFVKEAKAVGRDVCTYRILTAENRPTVKAVAGTMGQFQRLVSIVYDAVKHGRKDRHRVSADAALETAFEFGYTFAGSVGIVFTLPNERLLLDLESVLDETMQTVVNMSKSREPSQFIEFARRLGVAPVRAMYSWAKEHVEGGVGAAIAWQKEREVKLSAVTEFADLQQLQAIIAATSEERSETLKVAGILLGADARPKRFHFKSDSGEEIRGSYEDAINPAQHPELFKRYAATINKTEVIHYATEEEDVKYHLVKLEDMGQRPYDEQPQRPEIGSTPQATAGGEV